MTPAGRRSVVRVVVDRDEGVTLDDIAEVSRAVSEVLDRNDDGMGRTPYVLEVTSPGVDRPLTEARHWRRNVGRLVTVAVGPAGRTQEVTGRVTAVDDAGRDPRRRGAGQARCEEAAADAARGALGASSAPAGCRSSSARVEHRRDDDRTDDELVDDELTDDPEFDDDDIEPAACRRREEEHSEHRRHRAQGGGAGEGHPRRHGDRGHRDGAGDRVPARRRRGQARARPRRPQERRGRRARPGARPGRRRSSASGTTPPPTSAGSRPAPPSRSSCSGCATPSTSRPSASTPARRATSSAASCRRTTAATCRAPC